MSSSWSLRPRRSPTLTRVRGRAGGGASWARERMIQCVLSTRRDSERLWLASPTQPLFVNLSELLLNGIGARPANDDEQATAEFAKGRSDSSLGTVDLRLHRLNLLDCMPALLAILFVFDTGPHGISGRKAGCSSRGWRIRRSARLSDGRLLFVALGVATPRADAAL